jgi:hypothetical protein
VAMEHHDGTVGAATVKDAKHPLVIDDSGTYLVYQDFHVANRDFILCVTSSCGKISNIFRDKS